MRRIIRLCGGGVLSIKSGAQKAGREVVTLRCQAMARTLWGVSTARARSSGSKPGHLR